jgi:hypothetical protein
VFWRRATSPSIPSRKPANKRIHAPGIDLSYANKIPAAIATRRLATVSILAVIPIRTRRLRKGCSTAPYQVRIHLESIVLVPFSISAR